MRWKDGSFFEGDWRNDMRVQGKLTLEDGGSYIGKFNNKDQYHGLGTIEYDKFRYTGIFSNHEPPKYGWLEVKDSGDIYYGELESFKKNGLGKMEFENGDIYEGQWLDDKPHGLGRLISKENNEIYVGNF